MSVEDSSKSPFLYGLPIGKLLVVGLRLKRRSSFCRTRLYSVWECGRRPEITIPVRTSYVKVVGSRRQKWRSSFFPYIPLQRMWVWQTASILNFVWTSYGEVVGSRVKAKMAIEFFFVHAYAAYVSVGDSLKSPFLYGLPIEKLVGSRVKAKMAI